MATVNHLSEFGHIIDVRTPSEFALDHVPGAINCPVLRDEERVRVGTLYKQESSFTAKKVGAALVARNVAIHLETMFQDKPRDWRPLVYCWRGGKRSGAMTHILREVGWDARQLDGGYKAYRRHIVEEIPQLILGLRFRVICGLTGSGKSRLLRALDAAGEQVLDLEALAAHKGSVLGSDPLNEQPAQKMFESKIWHALRHFSSARLVYVESESKKVGNLRVPETLVQAMWASECVWVETGLEHRVSLLKQEYEHFIKDPEALAGKLLCLRGLHGAELIGHWCTQARAGNFDALVAELLERHYDPAYTKSIHAHYARLSDATRTRITGTTSADFDKLAYTLRALT
ncbi:MAG: tRNA 2-selenouridine(34) synthase MnmH [Betaproteobacteria bacterium]|nr:tRNA 2-selenouridine(34) synthase MnmH [Betaproteobacteria bacterium]